jgi:hypothetical protein
LPARVRAAAVQAPVYGANQPIAQGGSCRENVLSPLREQSDRLHELRTVTARHKPPWPRMTRPLSLNQIRRQPLIQVKLSSR